jgi:hypothetical protein
MVMRAYHVCLHAYNDCYTVRAYVIACTLTVLPFCHVSYTGALPCIELIPISRYYSILAYAYTYLQAEDAHSRAAQRAEEAFSKLVALSKAYRKLEDDSEALRTIATSAQAAAQVDVNAALRERDAAHSRAAVAEAAAADRARAVTEAEQR